MHIKAKIEEFVFNLGNKQYLNVDETEYKDKQKSHRYKVFPAK